MWNSFKYCRNSSSSEKDGDSFNLQIEIIFKEENSEVLHSEQALCGVVTGPLGEVEQKHLQNFEMWCWRRKGKRICTVSMRNKEV
jgi:hypothetical protein